MRWFSTFAACVLVTLLPLMALVILGYLVMITRLFSFMRRHHPEPYQALGEPHLIFNNSIAMSRRVAEFIRDEEYAQVGDPVFTAKGDRVRLLYRASMGLFIASLVTLFVFWFSL